MAYTKIADVIQPELFAQYVIDKTSEKSEIMNAGVVENNAELNRLITGGGTILTMPKWNDLGGKSQVLDDTNPIEVNNITSKSELATLLIRANAWGAHELAGALAGDDPMKAIADRVSDWWVRDEKSNIISILNGVFGSSSMSGLVHDISAQGTSAISANAVLDAKQLMGDASDLLTMIYMHSATFTELQKQNVIQFIPVAESKIQIPTYLGYRVVCDDSAPFLPKAKAVYELTLGGTFATDDTITVDSETYTVLATDTTNTILASSLVTALKANATLNGKFDITSTGAVVKFVQKVEGTGDRPTVTKSSTAGTVAIVTVTSGLAKSVYTTYLLARGAIQRGMGTPVSLTQVETDRDSLGSTDYLINRQAKVLHPKGISWVGGALISGATPSDAELANGSYWNRVSEIKKVGMVKLVHTLD